MASKNPEADAITLLKADHRKVEDLFAKFEKANGTAAKEKLVHQICQELIVHTMLEEEIFYPACAQAGTEEDTVHEAYVEHDGAKVLIGELLESTPEDEFYDAKVTVLSEEIKHHVKEEEKRGEGLFAQAKDKDVDLRELGAQIRARKEEVLQEIESQGLPALQTRSFSGHKLKQGKPVEATNVQS